MLSSTDKNAVLKQDQVSSTEEHFNTWDQSILSRADLRALALLARGPHQGPMVMTDTSQHFIANTGLGSIIKSSLDYTKITLQKNTKYTHIHISNPQLSTLMSKFLVVYDK